MSKRPLIAVTESRGGKPFMPWFNWLALHLAGARTRRLVAPLRADALSGVQGLLIGGGEDIGVDLYGGIPVPMERLDPDRDAMEFAALDDASERGIPVLGVCRGSQILNVYHGGSLHQDIYEVYSAKPRDRTVFPRVPVTVSDNTILAAALATTKLRVNSLHHQSVDRLGDDFIKTAVDEYGIVQATERPGDVFCVGVQWHPEFMFYHPAQYRLLKTFVQAARAEREIDTSK